MPSILRDFNAVNDAVQGSTSLTQALKRLGLRAAGGNYRALHEACARFALKPPVYVAWKPPVRDPLPDEMVFCENSVLKRSQIKARLFRRGVPK